LYYLVFQKHAIPISAIPCLQYRKAIEKEELEKNNPDIPVVDADKTLTNGNEEGSDCLYFDLSSVKLVHCIFNFYLFLDFM